MDDAPAEPMPPEPIGSSWNDTTPAMADAVRFLQGPQPRAFELGRAMSIFAELIRGFRKLHFVGPCVTVFGSARFPEDHPNYVLARQVGRLFAERGFAVMTGGGPGIMEAANRGAKDVGGLSIGCNILLPKEQKHNDYLDTWIDFQHFFVRKLMLIKYSYAFIVLPGGFGTMDELFEVLTLIQTGKLQDFPVAMMGTDYYKPGVDMLRVMLDRKTIDGEDLDKLIISDDPVDVANRVTEVAMKKFGLTYGARLKPKWWLGEALGSLRRT